jgi:hypothetical protein
MELRMQMVLVKNLLRLLRRQEQGVGLMDRQH